MGLGCNAAGIVGCRIIDSKRERLIAILTNSLVPCNGKFPTILLMLTIFFTGGAAGTGSVLTAICLTGVLLLGIAMTFMCSRILSKTILKGIPSSFTLELPPYRRPQVGRVVIRSILERTLFVLGRAAVVAAPAGLIIWLTANIVIGDMSILAHMTSFFDPFAKLFGLDGTIWVAFFLGFPANEIVVPIMIMAYLSEGTLMELGAPALHQLLLANGWTIKTGICFLLFCLMHWPCSTTCLTIKKETKSIGWTIIAVLIPTICGLTLCFLVNLLLPN